MDINKIIMESISNTTEDSTKPTETKEVITENTEQPVNDETTEEETGGYSPIQSAIPAAISAGLGAVALRNKLRNMKGE